MTRKPLPANAIPNEFDPNNYCVVYNKFFKYIKYYRFHLKYFHKMRLTSLKRAPNPNITSNLDNASNHCEFCNWTFSGKGNYNYHLRSVHKMTIPNMHRRGSLNPNISPDINDPNFYCKSCQFKYKTRIIYRSHLRKAHKMEVFSNLYDPSISIDGTKDPNNRASATCKIQYGNKYTCRDHFKIFHANGRNTPITTGNRRTRANSNIPPNHPDDPNLYCASCKKQYASRNSYGAHLSSVYPDVKLDMRESSNITPIVLEIDAGNCKNTRCTVCDYNFTIRINYPYHVNRFHKDGNREPVVSRGKIKAKPDPNIIPVWDDPRGYCGCVGIIL